jgi:hypothetical protein
VGCRFSCSSDGGKGGGCEAPINLKEMVPGVELTEEGDDGGASAQSDEGSGLTPSSNEIVSEEDIVIVGVLSGWTLGHIMKGWQRGH